MVKGMESFIEKFRDYTDCYTVIGGAACDILMSDADLTSAGNSGRRYTV